MNRTLRRDLALGLAGFLLGATFLLAAPPQDDSRPAAIATAATVAPVRS